MTMPFHLYVHFPFCRSRCPYCAFYFVVGHRELHDSYLAAVRREIERAAEDPRFAGRRVATVYFGGGTPSLMRPGALGALLDRIASCFVVEPDAEVSLEANPEGLDEEGLRGFRTAGVNRLTLGWQSLRAEGLKALGRIHKPADAVRSMAAARAAGHDNVGVDLIFGRPGQTPEQWTAELAEVVAAGPEHVSAYELTVEEGTALERRRSRGRLALPDEDARADMFEATDVALAAGGLVRYEISNFARPGFECRHNLAGWRGEDLRGVGTSAASHLANIRWTNVADLAEYLRRLEAGEDPADPPETLDEETWAAEDLYLGLRTVGGTDAEARLARVPRPGRLREVLAHARREGLLEASGGRTRLTARGRLLADSVFDDLLGG